MRKITLTTEQAETFTRLLKLYNQAKDNLAVAAELLGVTQEEQLISLSLDPEDRHLLVKKQEE